MIWLALVVALAFGAGAILGAPYLPILRRDRERALDLAGLKPGQTLLDLGSGDGRLLRAAARRGIRGIGYEINPFLVWISRLVCWRYRHLVQIRLANYWDKPLPEADAVYVFLLDRYMARLAAKLEAEIAHPTPVISYIFAFPDRQAIQSTHNTFVYQFKPTRSD